jgi:hypothetical protein
MLAWYLAAYRVCPAYRTPITKGASFFFVVIGGLVILASINSSLAMFRGRSFKTLFRAFMRDFPWLRRTAHVHLVVDPFTVQLTGHAPTVEQTATTLEERMARAEIALKAVREQLNQHHAAFIAEFENVREEVRKSVATQEASLQSLEQKVEAVNVGSFKPQVFGVTLGICGAFLSILT